MFCRLVEDACLKLGNSSPLHAFWETGRSGLTIEALLDGALVQMPLAHGTFKQAQNVRMDEGGLGALDLGM